MRPITIARNYAEVLFALGEKSGRSEAYADLLDAVAAAVELDPKIQAVMMSPRVPKQAKSADPGRPRSPRRRASSSSSFRRW